MKSLLALSLIAGLSLSALPVQAQLEELPSYNEGSPLAMVPLDAPGANPLNGGPAGGKMKLSNEQLEKMYKLKNNLLDEIGPKVTELQKQSRHLKDLLTQESLDKGSIQATQDRINSLKADISNLKLSFKMDMNENLTAEQRQSLRYRMIKPHKMRHRKGHGRGHMRNQGPVRRGFSGEKNVIGERFQNPVGPQAQNPGADLTDISESI